MTEASTPRHWSQLSLLDVVRPAPGWHATDVVFSTYSLDLVIMVSALLALTGGDDLEGSGSKVGLAAALNHFRPGSANRLAVLVQTGRITSRVGSPSVLALLDRFVREVRRNQRSASWHAKAALVRFETSSEETQDKVVEWRLWIGSRNLSRDMSWDTGLVLIGSPERFGGNIKGMQGLAVALFTTAEWPRARQRRLLRELNQVRWLVPKGIEVSGIHWLDGNRPWRPPLPEAPSALTVITPFFDRNALGQLATQAGDADKRLLTTASELGRRVTHLGQDLAAWHVMCLDSSEQALALGDDSGTADAGPDGDAPDDGGSEDEFVPLGLHAKIIASRKGNRAFLLIGSANITRRAWRHNTEIVLSLEGDLKLLDGIEALLGQASYAPTELTPDMQEMALEQLDTVRNALCNLCYEQRLRGQSVEVNAGQLLREAFEEREWAIWERFGARLAIAPLSAPMSECVHWPVDQQRVELPIRETTLAGDTEFLQFRLACRAADGDAAKTDVTLSWVQRVPMVPELDVSREKRLLARYLDARQYLDWVHSLLEGYETDLEPWDQPPGGKKVQARGYKSRAAMGAPTLESLLKAWQKDNNSLDEVAGALERYFDDDALQQDCRTDADKEALSAIASLRKQLQQMLPVLGCKRS